MKVGNLVTLNQDVYPSLGTWFVQIWEGEDVAARIYGDDRETLNRRLKALGFEQAMPEPEPEPEEDPEDDDDEPICGACNGSGEGMYDGSTCYKCHGYGHERPEKDDEP